MKKSQLFVLCALYTCMTTFVDARIADGGPEPISFSGECLIDYSDGGKFPSSDQGFFEKLGELKCPSLSYKLPGYYSTNVEEIRFIVYWEWRGGIAGSCVGVCVQSRRASSSPEIPSQYKCYFPDPNQNTDIFDKGRRK